MTGTPSLERERDGRATCEHDALISEVFIVTRKIAICTTYHKYRRPKDEAEVADWPERGIVNAQAHLSRWTKLWKCR